MGGCGSKGAHTRSPGSSGIKITNDRSVESASYVPLLITSCVLGSCSRTLVRGEKVKIILVGAGGVGKTSILLQFSVRFVLFCFLFRFLPPHNNLHSSRCKDGLFSADRPPTIGVGTLLASRSR